jgi:hypothetical protein
MRIEASMLLAAVRANVEYGIHCFRQESRNDKCSAPWASNVLPIVRHVQVSPEEHTVCRVATKISSQPSALSVIAYETRSKAHVPYLKALASNVAIAKKDYQSSQTDDELEEPSSPIGRDLLPLVRPDGTGPVVEAETCNRAGYHLSDDQSTSLSSVSSVRGDGNPDECQVEQEPHQKASKLERGRRHDDGIVQLV